MTPWKPLINAQKFGEGNLCGRFEPSTTPWSTCCSVGSLILVYIFYFIFYELKVPHDHYLNSQNPWHGVFLGALGSFTRSTTFLFRQLLCLQVWPHPELLTHHSKGQFSCIINFKKNKSKKKLALRVCLIIKQKGLLYGLLQWDKLLSSRKIGGNPFKRGQKNIWHLRKNHNVVGTEYWSLVK